MIVNFSIPNTLSSRIDSVIQKKGFTSKAEFFRFSVMCILDMVDREQSEEDRFEILSKKLEKAILKKYNGADSILPTLEDQMKDL